MRAPLITLTHVSKKYRLYERHARRLLEVLHPFGKRYHTEFWAVCDVSLRIHAGQTIGIIGRNGSGKSTLLQMIAGLKHTTGKFPRCWSLGQDSTQPSQGARMCISKVH
jgi:lipopolysaccharide transport system ATP-binding protein